MSGHSKWNNIKRKKEGADAARAKIFARIGKEIAIAVRDGGPNPDSNNRLRDVIAKAKANNVPNDNINRMLQKASGSDTADYFSMTYEGYGPGGVAVIVETLTDNKNRTASDVRHHFDKYGGNMGATGCVSWQFTQKGVIVIDNEEGELDEDEVMMEALDAGADDFTAEDGIFEVYTNPDDFSAVSAALEEKGYTFVSAEVAMVPSNYVKLTSEKDIANMQKMLDVLDDCDDVQNVWHNWDQEE
ncbi:MAG: YebC/PmpR family DNA-binding transcriptional regulator [Oscillospiraceae bacterium]|nr:YebC/PmpR family DNA-binding transcriptional regulator [Oscillospiraceae bacterium]